MMNCLQVLSNELLGAKILRLTHCIDADRQDCICLDGASMSPYMRQL
jgi:hypothetical protein